MIKIKLLYPEVYEIARYGKRRKEYPPLGLLYVASSMIKEGWMVDIEAITPETSPHDYSTYDVVGYSLSSSCTYNMMKKDRLRSKFSKNTLIIVGGIHASIFPKEVLQQFDANALIVGEGEEVTIKAIKSLKYNITSYIKGVMFNYNDDIEFAESIKNLSDLQFPARELLPEEDFIFEDRLSRMDLRMVHIFTSRGCPFNCYFCSSQIKKHRYREAKDIYDELMYLKEKYNIKGFVINDENFTIRKDKVFEICNEIKKTDLIWSALSRVDTIDNEMLKKMRESNCIELKLGMESGSDRMLKYMNKGITVEENEKALKLCNENGIKSKIFFIHGFPGENLETTEESICFLEKNKEYIDRISLFRWTPLPGSYAFNNPKQFGLNEKLLTNDNAVIYNNEGGWFLEDNINYEIDAAYKKIKKYIIDNF